MATVSFWKRHHNPVLSYSNPDDPKLRRLFIRAVERASGWPKLERLYAEVREEQPPAPEVWDSVLGKLRIGLNFDPQKLDQVPSKGPLVILANHPFGVVDGLAMGKLMSARRDQFRILVNDVLCREPMFDDFFLPVDFRENRQAMETNLETRRQSAEVLRQGGALGIFPAGGIATANRVVGKAKDLEWKRFVAKLIQQFRPTVVPMYFPGQNSRLFHLASVIHLDFRLSLLLNEVRNKMGQTISVVIGDPIPPVELAAIRDRQALLDHLREQVFALRDTSGSLLDQSPFNQ